MGTASRTCSSCHTPLPDEARFCLRCGAPTPTEAHGAVTAAPPEDAEIQRLREALADRYAVESVLGHGGMATVYLAEDLKHRRKVAVKVLRSELAVALGAERFLREIEIAAQLTHPHILPLHDSGEADGFLYYVMPNVEGESLREKLARERELPVPEALRILRDVADALAHAHAHDVVHRDIKPDNVMLSGRHALVTDFGVAKAVSHAGHETLTTAGISVGTPTYMAPEQATADPHIDHRADIYALGVLGYELLAGEPPITGENAPAVLSAHVLERPRPLTEHRPNVPVRLSQAIMRCLEKKAADRWQTADDLLAQLEALATPSGGVTPTGARPATGPVAAVSRRTIAIASGAAVIIAAAIVMLLTRWGAAPGSAAAPVYTQLTFKGTVSRAEISPDGELLAYVEKGDPDRLFVKDLTGGTVIEIAEIGSVGSLLWSPDGASLLVGSLDSTDRRVTVTYPRLGGPPRPLSGVATAVYVVWAPDGLQVAHWWMGRRDGTNPIRFTTLATGDTGSVEAPDSVGGFFFSGDWSPNGRFIALASFVQSPRSYHLWTVAVDGSGWHRLAQDTDTLAGPRWSPAGDAVYYLRGDELQKVRVAPDGQVRGAPEVLQVGLDAGRDLFNPGLSLTADGRTLVFTKVQRHSNVRLATASGQGEGAQFTTVQLTHGTASKSRPQLSPDGKWIAYVQYEKTEGDVFVVPTDGGTPRRVTSGSEAVIGPAWSPDGTALAFGAATGGKRKVRTVLVDRGQVRTYEETEMGSGGLAWAPGKRIVYSTSGNPNFHLLDPETEAEEPLVANDSVGFMFTPHYSPDGEHVAVFWNRVARPELRGTWVVSLEDSSQTLVYPGGADALGWAANGQSIYVQEEGSDDILLVPVSGGEASVVATVPFGVVDYYGGASVDCVPVERSDGLALFCDVDESVSDAWMIENFDPDVR
jgi:serine/threonine-protein kinase